MYYCLNKFINSFVKYLANIKRAYFKLIDASNDTIILVVYI